MPARTVRQFRFRPNFLVARQTQTMVIWVIRPKTRTRTTLRRHLNPSFCSHPRHLNQALLTLLDRVCSQIIKERVVWLLSGSTDARVLRRSSRKYSTYPIFGKFSPASCTLVFSPNYKLTYMFQKCHAGYCDQSVSIFRICISLDLKLMTNAVLQGYMYLTNSHLCFFAHMPSREVCICNPLANILTV